MSRLLLVWCSGVCAVGLCGEPASEPVKYKAHSLVRFRAEGVDPKAGIIWRVHPAAGVQRATTAKHILEFAAPPGLYTVTRLVIRTGADGAVDIEEWEAQVEVEPACGQAPVPPPKGPKEPKGPKADPHGALGRIQFGSSGCTATVVWPRRPDGRWDVLTAEHCVRPVSVGGKGQMQLRGQAERLAVVLAAKDRESDCAWLVTERADLEALPFAVLAAENGPPKTRVWHAGYGVDRPGNREDGTVTLADTGHGKTEFVLNVSSGDSGGGIFRDDTGELISCVCCTVERGAKVTMYGANVDAIRRLRPRTPTSHEAEGDWWTPLALPVVPGTASDPADWWTPTALPQVEAASTKTRLAPPTVTLTRGDR